MTQMQELPDVLTALITPFTRDGAIDWKGWKKNIGFQIDQGIEGIVPVGTTGESPVLTSEEHQLLIALARQKGREIFVLAGCGSNSTEEALKYAQLAEQVGCEGVLLVDCYYNGPSSLELRREYYSPIARKFPNLVIVPYIIPGRTGCALLPEDLALLAHKHPNVMAVKEATDDFSRMRRTRELAPDGFDIFSGDDNQTVIMMQDEKIGAKGVISVVANIAPSCVHELCRYLSLGDDKAAREVENALEPLIETVKIQSKREERIPGRENLVTVTDKFRNPLPIKTMMSGLGMPAGFCRKPLGRLSTEGVMVARRALQEVWRDTPGVLCPIEMFYGVDIKERLADDMLWEQLAYPQEDGEEELILTSE